MNEELQHFLEAVKTDPGLSEKVCSLQTAAEVVEEAAQRGFNFSESDMTATVEGIGQQPDGEGICSCAAGGMGAIWVDSGLDTERTEMHVCACVVLGYGYVGNDDIDPVCGCGIVGFGAVDWRHPFRESMSVS